MSRHTIFAVIVVVATVNASARADTFSLAVGSPSAPGNEHLFSDQPGGPLVLPRRGIWLGTMRVGMRSLTTGLPISRP